MHRRLLDAPRSRAPTLVQTGYGERVGQAPRALDIRKPLGTVVAGGAKHALVSALITKHYGGVFGHGPEKPLGTITTQDHHAVTTATLVGGTKREQVRDLLRRFAPGAEPIVRVGRETYEVSDLSMRMFAPHELFAAQGFPSSYVIEPLFEGKPLSKTKQIGLAGNSVCPQLSRALVSANVRSFAESIGGAA